MNGGQINETLHGIQYVYNFGFSKKSLFLLQSITQPVAFFCENV